MASRSAALVPVEHITQSILILRGQRVLLDAELAALYGVSTKRFNEQVRRNRGVDRVRIVLTKRTVSARVGKRNGQWLPDEPLHAIDSNLPVIPDVSRLTIDGAIGALSESPHILGAGDSSAIKEIE